jgi:hypothetical protein
MRKTGRPHVWFYSPIEVPRVPVEKSGDESGADPSNHPTGPNRKVIAPILSNPAPLGKKEPIKK